MNSFSIDSTLVLPILIPRNIDLHTHIPLTRHDSRASYGDIDALNKIVQITRRGDTAITFSGSSLNNGTLTLRRFDASGVRREQKLPILMDELCVVLQCDAKDVDLFDEPIGFSELSPSIKRFIVEKANKCLIE